MLPQDNRPQTPEVEHTWYTRSLASASGVRMSSPTYSMTNSDASITSSANMPQPCLQGRQKMGSLVEMDVLAYSQCVCMRVHWLLAGAKVETGSGKVRTILNEREGRGRVEVSFSRQVSPHTTSQPRGLAIYGKLLPKPFHSHATGWVEPRILLSHTIGWS